MNINKKKLWVSVFFMAILGVSLGSQTLGTLNFGFIVPILDITVSSESAASNLPISSEIIDLKVGSVVKRSNKKVGYTITLASANAALNNSSVPSLRSSTNPGVLDYELKYAGTAVVFVGGSASVVSLPTEKSPASGITNDVTISYKGIQTIPVEDIFSDILTFSIIAR